MVGRLFGMVTTAPDATTGPLVGNGRVGVSNRHLCFSFRLRFLPLPLLQPWLRLCAFAVAAAFADVCF